MSRASAWSVGLVLVCAVAYSLWLQTAIRGPVFPLTDAGMKYLQVRQFARGEWHVALDLEADAPSWVRPLWNDGQYPLRWPAVVEYQGRRYSLFSYVFPLLSALPYRLLGWRGLTVLPLLGVWLAWAALLLLLFALRIRPALAAATLALMAFGSPLTYYSATFWEHAPAIGLALLGLALSIGTGDRAEGRAPFAGGLCLGLAVLLREELALAAALLGAAAVLALVTGRPFPFGAGARRVVAGLALGAALIVAANVAGYGHPLGIHVIAALGAKEWAKEGVVLRVARVLVPALPRFFPLVLFALAVVPWLWRRRHDDEARHALLMVGMGVVFVALIPPLVRSDGGREWGPRYYLWVMSLAALASAIAVELALRHARLLGRALAVTGFAVAALAGVWVNLPGATAYLFKNYRTRQESLDRVLADDARVIAVSHYFVTLGVVGALGPRTFVLADQGKDLRALLKVLHEQKQDRFLYLCYPAYPCHPLDDDVADLTLYRAGTDRPMGRFHRLGEFGRYVFYSGEVLGD